MPITQLRRKKIKKLGKKESQRKYKRNHKKQRKAEEYLIMKLTMMGNTRATRQDLLILAVAVANLKIL